MLGYSVFVGDDDLVSAFILLLEVLDAEDGSVGGAVGPTLEPTALHGQVFEALYEENTLVRQHKQSDVQIERIIA